MQTQHIVSFYYVARLRSITKAADIQGLAQPTVTSHLKKLEEELGFSLFDRIKRPIMLTSDGAAVLEMIGPIVNGLSALKIHADSQGRDVSLTIAGLRRPCVALPAAGDSAFQDGVSQCPYPLVG